MVQDIEAQPSPVTTGSLGGPEVSATNFSSLSRSSQATETPNSCCHRGGDTLRLLSNTGMNQAARAEDLL
jgi:hypothetical protein